MELFNQIFKYLTTVRYAWELTEVINFEKIYLKSEVI